MNEPIPGIEEEQVSPIEMTSSYIPKYNFPLIRENASEQFGDRPVKVKEYEPLYLYNMALVVSPQFDIEFKNYLRDVFVHESDQHDNRNTAPNIEI